MGTEEYADMYVDMSTDRGRGLCITVHKDWFGSGAVRVSEKAMAYIWPICACTRGAPNRDEA